MSDSDGIASPSRQRRSTERSRENIREYVKLLGKKRPESTSHKASHEDKSMSISPSKSSTESEGNEESPSRMKKEYRGSDQTLEFSSQNVPISSPKGKSRVTSSYSVMKLPKKDTAAQGNVQSPGPPSGRDKIIVHGLVVSSTSKAGKENSDIFSKETARPENIDGICGYDEASSNSGTSGNRQKTEKKAESMHDSPPDLTIFLKEGHARNQSWSEPPVLDPESIATRRRTRVPTEAKLQTLIKSKSGDILKNKLFEGGKKEGKKDKKNLVLETPVSLKRLAQPASCKETTHSCEMIVSKTKMRLFPVRGNAEDRKNPQYLEGIGGEGRRSNRLLLRTSDDSLLSTSEIEEISKNNDGRLLELSQLKKTSHGTNSLPVTDDSNSEEEVASNSEVRRHLGVKKRISKQKEKYDTHESNRNRPTTSITVPQTESSQLKNAPKTKKPLVLEDTKKSVKDDEIVGKVSKAKHRLIPFRSANKRDINITRTISKPVGKKVGNSSSGEAVFGEVCSKGSSGMTVLKGDSSAALDSSNLVTIAAANPGDGSPLKFRKIHLKIPSVPRLSSASFNKSSLYESRLENVQKGDIEKDADMTGSSTPQKMERQTKENSDSDDLNLRLSPIPQSVELFDFSDIEAEEVVVGEVESRSTPERDTVKLTDSSPQAAVSESNLCSEGTQDSSSDDDKLNLNESQNCIRKNLLRSPEGRVALDHSYSSGSSEGSKGSGSQKKKSPISLDKTLSPRQVYSSASVAKRSLDIMMHNDKINILRQMSQIFNNEKPIGGETSEEIPSYLEADDGVCLKSKLKGKEENKNKNSRTQDSDYVVSKPTSYVLTSDKTLCKSPSKLLMIEPMQIAQRASSDVRLSDSECKTGDKSEKVDSVKQRDDNSEGKTVESTITLVKGQVGHRKELSNMRKALGLDKRDDVNEENLTESSNNESMSLKIDSLKDKHNPNEEVTPDSPDKKLHGCINSVKIHKEQIIIPSTSSAKHERHELGTSKESSPLDKEFCDNVIQQIVDKDSHEDLNLKMSVIDTVSQEEPFIGFPDNCTKARVYHVSSYSALPDENIQVESKTGSRGEFIDIIDGFTFVSFDTEKQMLDYSQNDLSSVSRKHKRFRNKKRRGMKLKRLKMNKMSSSAPSSTSQRLLEVEQNTINNNSQILEHDELPVQQSSAFSSNDLDAFLDKNSRLNISYSIPTCKATEDGVTRLSDEMLADGKVSHSQYVRNPVQTETSDTPVEEHNDSSQTDEGTLDPLQPYEEVNAMDILYPKEKYKYYYDKNLCKQTEADGSNVFVRRGGKLVPLTSVFKSQKSSISLPDKSVELVYVYDGGKLLTLGGSLTKLNPSHSDSVRARVLLPIGTPPIHRDVTLTKKQVQTVEIDEEMAKFALSALQFPNGKPLEKQGNASKDFFVETVSPCAEKPKTAEDDDRDKKDTKGIPKALVKPTKTNILDIIAAKLAMSDDESDGKEEELDPKGGESVSDAVIDDNNGKVDAVEVTKTRGKVKEEDENEGELRKKNNTESELMKSGIENGYKDVTTKKDIEFVGDEVKEKFHHDVLKKLDEDEYIHHTKVVLNVMKKEESELSKNESKAEHLLSEKWVGKDDRMYIKDIKAENDNKGKDIKNMDIDQSRDTLSSHHEKKENCVFSENVNDIKEQNDKESKAVAVERHHLQDSVHNKIVSDNSALTMEGQVCETIGDGSKLRHFEASTDNFDSLEEIGEPSGRKILHSKTEVKRDITTLEYQEAKGDSIGKQTDEGSIDSSDSGDTSIVKASRSNTNRSKVIRRNIQRFPSLSREMKRLSMNFVNYTPKASDDEENTPKPELPDECTNEFCKMGCICESLLCCQRDPEHCGRIECMFECTCRDESWKHPVCGSGRSINAVSIFNLDREQMEGLAIREKDFRRTVIQTGSEVILVGAERKKRERKIPGRYRDSNVWAGNDPYGSACVENSIDAKGEYPGIPVADAYKYVKKCSVTVPWYDIKGISIWCMEHSCYDCKCFKDSSYSSSCECSPESERHVPLPCPREEFSSLPVKESKPCNPSCVIVNVDVRNSQSKRRYFWKLKEWYHPVHMHAARTCGYYSSRTRAVEETKQMNISGPQARETTPEKMVEDVVRNLRYEKSKEYLYELKYSEHVGGASPLKLRNLIGQRKVIPEPASDNLSRTVPVVDLTANITDNNQAGSSSTSCIVRPPNPEEAYRKRCLEEKYLQFTKRRRLSGASEMSMQHQDDLLNLQAVASQAKQGYPNPTIGDEGSNSNNESSIGLDDGKQLTRKQLSLAEMMITEEKRGELEIDLSVRQPGNALLVAENRFRKLINMNIIGVTGINKAGRCIISSVESAQSLRTMQRIHTMISNNSLDVGPNMREIFFPSVHVAPRPRFVMIRCDSHMKWEIVGVVQKKGPVGAPRKSSEQKQRSATLQKPAVSTPQVIDLEEEEDEKEETNDTKENASGNEESNTHNSGSSNWQGCFPKIASVQGGSDIDILDVQEVSAEMHDNATVLPVTVSVPSSVPSLIPLTIRVSSPTKPELVVIDNDSDKLKTNSDSVNSNLKIGPKFPPNVASPIIASPHLYFVPTAFSTTTTTTVTSNLNVSPVTAVPGMRILRLNQSSARVFGENSVKPLASQQSQPFVPGTSSHLMATSAPVLSKSGFSLSSPEIFGKGAINITKTLTLHPDNGPQTLPVGISPLSQSPSLQNVTSASTSPLLNQKTFYMPSSSGGLSKMVLLPANKTPSSSVMMLSPTGKGQDAPTQKKVLLVPSTVDSGKMVLIPMPSFGNEPLLSNADSTSGASGRDGSELGKMNKTIPILPKLKETNEQVSSSEVQILSAVGISSFHTKSPEKLVKDIQKSPGRSDSCSPLDDIVVLGSSASSSVSKGIANRREESQSIPPAHTLAPSWVPASSSKAVTTVVSSSSLISSTLRQSAQQVLSPLEKNKTSLLDAKVKSCDIPMQKKSEITPSLPDFPGSTPAICSEKQALSKSNDNDDITLLNSSENQDKIDGFKDVQETISQAQIKKGGYHWSAVDLSLNFKSVKLEWLLGTIRKNVMINIYRMSVKTQLPVTLSVKNGVSMSMLYGLARKNYTDPVEGRGLPVLILGSVVSAVMSSSSVGDSLLFKANAVKYFIREPTGELASYTYNPDGCSLVKLASKKRAETGEMVGIGETVSLAFVRDAKYREPVNRLPRRESQEEILLGNSSNTCTCISEGHYICLGHSTLSDGAKPVTLSADQPAQSHLDDKGEITVAYSEDGQTDRQQYTIAEKKVECLLNSEQKNFLEKHVESRFTLMSGQTSTVTEGGTAFNSQQNNETVPGSTCNQSDCEILCIKSAKNIIVPKETSQSYEVLPHGRDRRSCCLPDDADKDELVDIEGGFDSGNVISSLRKELTFINAAGNVGKQLKAVPETTLIAEEIESPNEALSSAFTPNPSTSRMSPTSEGREKRHRDSLDHEYDKPCPLSKKMPQQVKASSTLFPARKEDEESGMTVAHLQPLSEVEENMVYVIPGPSGLDVNQKLKVKHKLGRRIQKLMKKDVKYVDVEGFEDEKNSELHNEQERRRRREIRQLFKSLNDIIVHNMTPPTNDAKPHQPKVGILKRAYETCYSLQKQCVHLTATELSIRKMRSNLIRKLGSLIAGENRLFLTKVVFVCKIYSFFLYLNPLTANQASVVSALLPASMTYLPN
ncbi:hypothetical protein SK128_028541 [Halocaridina rubra]|uniref:BHLH domain-containing protein n=1 Tax=Halocaridina rubra TaxID=373956 RepID=A0AAN9AF15_HALRR